MDKLQRDGVLQLTHDESLEKCKSCIFRKMVRKCFPHQVERAQMYVAFLRLCQERVLVTSLPLQMILAIMGYALESVVRILNMVQTKKVERMPYEIWHGKAPMLSYLRYPKEMIGYYFYYPLENKIFVARNAEFFKKNLMVQEASRSHGPLKSSGSDKGLEIIQEEDTQPSENNSEEHNDVAPIVVERQNVKVHIHRSARIPQAPDIYGFYVDVVEYELRDLDKPPNYKDALSDPRSDKWLEAMNTEMQFIKDNQVWVLVELPPNDYEETFSPVVDIRAIRILLAIIAFYDYEIWQMDVKTAFLNGHLSKDVYMVQPLGFMGPKHPNKFCKLQHFIYGWKQASRSWNKRENHKEILDGNSKKGYTPMIEKRDYRKSQGAKTPSEVQRMQRVPYASAIGSIIEIYWTAVKTILNYLRNTKDMVLVYGAKPEAVLKVSCYVDASFQTNKDDTKSQMGYVFVLNGGVVD
ncbi:retrotransposon protein, putative, ty1-copia subclass [Tanacetum coccineum]|uniref:Retrotransposon protein, putative, ty1-copia subclass n=1 Tax=Tanacetum coccineum TaxID=301880 RepID=A0ABQ5A993_9ASTR